MKKNIILSSLIIVIITLTICGCNEQESVKTEENKNKVTLISDLVELAESNFEIIKEQQYNEDCECFQEVVKGAEVTYLLHNRLDRYIRVRIEAEFYDNDNNIIATGGPKWISLIEDHTEVGIFEPNTIRYSGSDAEKITHVILIAEEDNK